MFGIGFSELLVILTVALLVIGPSRLPELARTLGQALAALRLAAEEARTIAADEDDTGPKGPHKDAS